MSERTLLLGYDLGNTRTQLAVYDRDKREPVLIGTTEENPDGFHDTVILLDDEEPVINFVEKIQRGKEILVGEKKTQAENVLAYYFRKTLSLTRKQYPGETIRQLVVTVEGTNKEFVQAIYDALEQLGIYRDRVVVLDYKQSFLYYVLSQKKELWINDVGLFDYHENSLNYYQMKVERSKNPILVGVQQKDYSDALTISLGKEEQQGAVFENIIYGAIHKQLLSTLFMTGEGFLGDWADDIFKKLCVGRRLFKGSNLYVSGACYAAREFVEHHLSDYLLLDEEMVTVQISVLVYSEAETKEIILVKAGTPWYLVDEEKLIIPDGDREISLCVKNVLNQTEKQFIIPLEPVLAKTEKLCRLNMRIRFASPKTCIVTLKDKGFGELFPSSNRIWEKKFDVV